MVLLVLARRFVNNNDTYTKTLMDQQMDQQLYILIIIIILSVTASIIGIIFTLTWARTSRKRQAREERSLEYEDKKISMEIEKLAAETDDIKIKNELEVQRLKQEIETKPQSTIGMEAGGYIILDLPREQHSLFHDLLKGFEEYAKLKGYSVQFSIDKSFPNQIAFKFTLVDEGISVSTTRVKQDIQEYILKVQKGDTLDDLPMILSPEEHHLILATMKNRISFLQLNHNLEKNAREFYEKIMKNIASQYTGVLPAPTIMVQTGGNMDSRRYESYNSSRLTQGDNNRLIDQSIDSSVRIADSFNDRKVQVDELISLIELLRQHDDQPDTKSRQQAIVNLEKVRDELSEEPKPDRSRIQKWLEKSKLCLENLKLTQEIFEKAKGVFESFGLSELISNLG